jgi:integrase
MCSSDSSDIKHGFVAACEDAESARLRFHDLRHTAASQLADAGADPFVIAEIPGHSDLRMTKRYTHTTDQRKRQALEQLAPYNRKAEELVAAQPICHNIVTMRERKVG